MEKVHMEMAKQIQVATVKITEKALREVIYQGYLAMLMLLYKMDKQEQVRL